MAKYPDLVRKYRFEPVAVETSGVFGSSTRTIIKEIGRKISEKTRDIREHSWLKQRLSIAIQRGNALTIMASARHMIEQT